jgi:acyl-CoA synthetase (AMP-forming)/AMP-acid ligase II
MFDGRKDFQIKHMGNRIELGEIETAASVIQGVKTVSSDYDTDKKEIKIFLLKHLPKYMVPTRYVKLDKFPYNDNGKIDRKSLKKQYIKE